MIHMIIKFNSFFFDKIGLMIGEYKDMISKEELKTKLELVFKSETFKNIIKEMSTIYQDQTNLKNSESDVSDLYKEVNKFIV